MKHAAKTIGLFEAKTKLSALVQSVKLGESFVITVRNSPVAELRPITPERLPLTVGCGLRPGYRMADDFNAELDDFALGAPLPKSKKARPRK